MGKKGILKEYYEEMNLSLQDENIDRVHRIGRTYTDKNNGKKSEIHHREV